ncbi:transcription initiation at TATA-containing promoter protein [Recurvomyces mirabilis]|nr:transcription initiation at TATA-containing promoter protein [Recurvomyces mirabilis]
MATDITVAPPTDAPEHVEQDSVQQSITNGETSTSLPQPSQDAANQDSFTENNALGTSAATTKDMLPDANPGGPTPVEDVASGIQPISDFIPKDAANNSHPTPPPDQPLATSEADVDSTMTDGEDGAIATSAPTLVDAPAPPAEQAPIPAEQSLVRPREDDLEDDNRAAKRSKVDDESHRVVEPITPAVTVPQESEQTVDSEPAAPQIEETAALASEENAIVDSDTLPAPTTAAPQEATAPSTAVDPEHVDSSTPTLPTSTPAAEAQPSIEAAAPVAPAASASRFTAPMTEMQKKVLYEKTKNLKKTKHSMHFLRPVDPVALNIPTYSTIVTQPMDLGTLDQKLKNSEYASVQAYVDDFNLIVKNSEVFNGSAHLVTQSGYSMKAYFDKMMENVPGPNQVATPKPAKRNSPAARAPRREPRQVPVPVAPPAMSAPAETYAVPDGIPQIRRESNGRPARAIKPPAAREISYAKPKRKEYQLELRFCEHVLNEVRGPRYAAVNSVFQMPVDPVALNIPHYRNIVKHPMDLSTIAQKLKQGQYAKASEFRKDFELIVENCLLFNPQGNPVRDMGIQLRRVFDQVWQTKEKWERNNKPDSGRGTSASADEDSGAEEDEDEDDEPEDSKEQTIQALQKQLADMQNMIAGMAGGAKPSKPKKVKSKDSKRKVGSLSSLPPKAKLPAPKPKKVSKPKQVSYEEKQEISEAVSNMDEGQVAGLTRIITENCAKYADMEDMELEIDDLPNNVQAMLLKYVRKLFGRPKGTEPMSPPDDGEMDDDIDFDPGERARGAAAKRKKHKPMGKREQQDRINQLSSKLEAFKQTGTSGSESPTGTSSFQAKAESSGDDESEESEEE